MGLVSGWMRHNILNGIGKTEVQQIVYVALSLRTNKNTKSGLGKCN